MNDEFDQQLRETFAQRAEQTPPVDLARASMQQAGGIRRRRRIMSGVAVLAVAAFVVPVGAQVIDSDSTDNTTSKPVGDKKAPADPVDVGIAGLEQGPEPTVPYIDGSEFHPTTGENDVLGVNSPAIDAIQVADGAIAWTLDPATGRIAYAATDESLDLPQGKAITSPTVNLETHEAAWSVTGSTGSDGKADIFVIADTDEGSLTSVPVRADEIRQVMGVYDGTVIYNGGSGKERYVGQSDVSTMGTAGLIPWAGATNVTAVSSDLTRMVGQTSDMSGPERTCSAMYSESSRQEQWRSCEWLPVEFSADASLLLALPWNVRWAGPAGVGGPEG